MRQNILITGSSGMLGTSLSSYLKSFDDMYDIYTQSYSKNGDYKVDLRNTKDTTSFLDKIRPDIIINLSALTDVDKCEANKQEAYLLNVKIVENITGWLSVNSNSSLIHISTDHFYDSIQASLENEIVIKNSYAFSKYTGELACDLDNTIVLRTNFVGKSMLDGRISFSDWLLLSLEKKHEISVLKDVFFSPLSIEDLCKYICLIISNIKKTGIYNLGSVGGISKADFCYQMANGLELSCSNITSIDSKDASFLKTARPKGMVMDSQKFMTTFGVQLPTINETITKIIETYK